MSVVIGAASGIGAAVATLLPGETTGCAQGRIGRAEEVAAVIKFLCSELASYLTGTDVLVDGGAVAVFG